MHANKRMQLEAGGLQAFAATRMTAVEDWLAVFLRERINGTEKRPEVALRIDILLPMGGKQEVAAWLEPKLLQDAARVDLVKVRAQHLRHGRPRHERALRRAPGGGEPAARVLGIGQVHVRDHVDDATIGLLWQAFILAAIARFHMKDGDVQALRRNGRQARVGVAQHEQSIRLDLHHKFVRGIDDVANRGAQVVAHRVHVDIRVVKREIAEEDAVQRVVVVLPRMREQAIEMPPALLDDLGQANDLRPRAHDDEELETAVVFEGSFETTCVEIHLQSLRNYLPRVAYLLSQVRTLFYIVVVHLLQVAMTILDKVALLVTYEQVAISEAVAHFDKFVQGNIDFLEHLLKRLA